MLIRVLFGLGAIALGVALIWSGLSVGRVVYDPTDAETMILFLVALGGVIMVLGFAMIFDTLPWRVACQLLSAFVGVFLLWSGANPEQSWVGTAQVRAPIFVMMIGAVAFLPLILAAGEYIQTWWAKRRQQRDLDHYKQSLDEAVAHTSSQRNWWDPTFKRDF